ncbi:winged helix-turn-helix transcriptional regulator [Enterococcus raffinosus]|uniref:Helix-turn-helix domain-containing protein n=1 Tax=Enterococcus raffinosus TaxID=71452 RepID=A0AAW8T5T5_9ENTE|nr:helix-turn-helix domain-containing protein [Enterococcus raffinosus]MDT2522018.1 helix-turn-helix domain-containing protein [Enterococcus raffinosus]MDT2528362.1 helix-turn-helix domain-containing protein [Enterococcus raffinosus]MDT2533172.1 helix-turn-helix domain-containing protein [Enterococcus raffinosus]MDT2543612.1 helix-turn-helix domain-containing protein [Enterococcus raffinosus]MDT2553726.1 helix-turn-helix domain-containing protein [Enterococcus raffinosus]
MRRKIYNCEDGCPVESTLQLISGRWKSVLLYHLIYDGEQRYNELQKKIPGITRRMLSLQLKDLESDGLIARHVIQEKPLMVAYHMTDYGNSLKPIIQMLHQWGNEFNRLNMGILEEANLL